MTSLKDVAKLAGVSVMTASRVINAKESVTRENRDRVIMAIDALGYRPNLTARSLRAQRSYTLGFLLPNIENPMFAALAKYVEEEANRLGYNLMVANTWENPVREASSLELMYSRLIDGIIISPVSAENDELINKYKLPTVVLDRSLKNNGKVPVVTTDNQMVGRLAARHLLSLGHRHFACLTGPLHINVFSDRMEGYRDELSQHGCSLDMIIRIPHAASVEQASSATGNLLRECKLHPLALFCVSDLAAIGAINQAKRMGLNVPYDLSVVGVDDIPGGEWITPPLTTIKQPFAMIASAGVKLLVRMLEEKGFVPDNINLLPEIVVRQSSGEYVGDGWLQKSKPRHADS